MLSSNKNTVGQKRATKKPGVTRFHRMVKRDGGITRDDAVQKIQRFIDQLKPTYLTWLKTDMELLEVNVEVIRAGSPGPDEWRKMYRQSCVIRDLGASFGYRSVTDVADSLCELVQRLESAGIDHLASIDTHVRALRLVGSVDADALTVTADHRLIEGLHAIVDMFPPRTRGEK